MKKWIMCVFAVMLLSLTLSVTAFAAEGDSGVYNVQNKGVTLTPMTAASENITPGNADVDGNQTSGFYKDAARVQVDLAGAVSGMEYLVIVTEGTADTAGTVPPDASNIVYIDQVTAPESGSVRFNVYPKALTSGKTYSVRISTNAGDAQTGKLTEKGSFQYYAAYTLGDVTGEGKINIADVTAVLNHIAGNKLLTGNSLLAANVANPSTSGVNIADATKILNYIAGNISTFD